MIYVVGIIDTVSCLLVLIQFYRSTSPGVSQDKITLFMVKLQDVINVKCLPNQAYMYIDLG